MASMSGAALPSFPPASPKHQPDTAEMFGDLVVSGGGKPRSALGLTASVVTHVVVVSLLVLVPILWPSPMPEHADYVRALLYDPPPPPPPPLPKGASLIEKAKTARPVTSDPKPQTPNFTAPIETPREPVKPDHRDPDTEQAGSTTGSDMGVLEGMEGGVEGGAVGGVPGGVLGGVVGGTGTGPVMDYDQAPRLLRKTDPKYTSEAFIKKIEGTVLLEILIDITGRVARVRVLKSVPLLDDAAIQSVQQWLFSPAIKNGRPVPTIAHVPVHFNIY